MSMYGKFTWKIENFSTIAKRELRSNVFEVGGYKWCVRRFRVACRVVERWPTRSLSLSLSLLFDYTRVLCRRTDAQVVFALRPDA